MVPGPMVSATGHPLSGREESSYHSGMTKTVLDVGNCSVDYADIERMIRRHFDAEVIQAASLEEVLKTLRRVPVALVLVNRRLHADTRDGMEVIRQIKGAPDLAETPVMLVTNYPEYQHEAVAAGAAYGFGKAELTHTETREKLRRFLE